MVAFEKPGACSHLFNSFVTTLNSWLASLALHVWAARTTRNLWKCSHASHCPQFKITFLRWSQKSSTSSKQNKSINQFCLKRQAIFDWQFILQYNSAYTADRAWISPAIDTAIRPRLDLGPISNVHVVAGKLWRRRTVVGARNWACKGNDGRWRKIKINCIRIPSVLAHIAAVTNGVHYRSKKCKENASSACWSKKCAFCKTTCFAALFASTKQPLNPNAIAAPAGAAVAV